MNFRTTITPPIWPVQMAHSVGVTHEPEIAEFDLDPRNDVMLVLATDGVWDVLSVEDIRKVRGGFVSGPGDGAKLSRN